MKSPIDVSPSGAAANDSRTYTFVFEPAEEGGFVVTCPTLRGLVTEGDTLDEARAMARDALQGYLESLLARGEAVPPSDAPPRPEKGRHGPRGASAHVEQLTTTLPSLE
jgi:antitoxin HicB